MSSNHTGSSSNNKSYNQNNHSNSSTTASNNNNNKAVKPPDFYQFHLKVNTDGSVENVSDAPACHHCRCAKIACDRKRPCRTCVRKDRPCFDYDPSLANNNKKDRGSSGSGSKQKSKTTKKTAQSSSGDAIHASIIGSSASSVVGGTGVSSDVGQALNASVSSTAENDHQSTISFPTAAELHAPQSRSPLSYSELFSMPTMDVTGSSVADSVAQQQPQLIVSFKSPAFKSGSTRLDDHYANEHANKRTRLNQGGYISHGVSSTFPATASSFSSSVSNHPGDSMNYTSVADTAQSQQLELLKKEVALLQFQLKQETAKSEKLRLEELKLRIGEEIDMYARWLTGGSVPRVKLTVDLWNPPVDPSKGIIICSSSWTLIGCNQTLRDLGSYSLNELQDNFDGSYLTTRSVAPMWKPLISLMMLSMVKNFKRQSYFGTKDGQSICVAVDISLHRSFFWAEVTPTDHLDDQVILDDVVISRTYRIPVSEAHAHSTSINPRRSFIRMLDALSAYSSRVAYQDDREKQETILRQMRVLALGASPDTSSESS